MFTLALTTTGAREELVVDRGTQHGVWVWHNYTAWSQLHGLSPESLLIADVDGNSQKDVVVDFGPSHGL